MSEQFEPRTDFYSGEWKALMTFMDQQNFTSEQKNLIVQTYDMSLDMGIGIVTSYLIDAGKTEDQAKQMLLEAGIK